MRLKREQQKPDRFVRGQMSKIVRDTLIEMRYSGSHFAAMPMPGDGSEVAYQITLIEDCDRLRHRIRTKLDAEMSGVQYDFVVPRKPDRPVR